MADHHVRLSSPPPRGRFASPPSSPPARRSTSVAAHDPASSERSVPPASLERESKEMARRLSATNSDVSTSQPARFMRNASCATPLGVRTRLSSRASKRVVSPGDASIREVSKVAGRLDEGLFTEALQLADDLGDLGKHGHESISPAVDQLEATLLSDLEVKIPHEDSGGSCPAQVKKHSSPTSLRTRGGLAPSDFVKRSRNCNSEDVFMAVRAIWKRTKRELLAVLAVAPIIIWLVTWHAEIAARVHKSELIFLRPLYVWAAARLAVLLCSATIGFLLQAISPYLPVYLLILIKLAKSTSLTAVVCALLMMVGPELHFDYAWEIIHSLPHWWGIITWWACSAISHPIILTLVHNYTVTMTTHHYGQRATNSYGAQKLLKKISNAARHQRSVVATASKRAGSESMRKNADDSVHSDSRRSSKTSASDWQTRILGKHLVRLSGPLNFGADAQAGNLEQVRKKALKLYEQLITIVDLWPDTMETENEDEEEEETIPLIAVEKIIPLLHRENIKVIDDEIDNVVALFGTAKTLKCDEFIVAVERVYKEQRLLSASVASFDKINKTMIEAFMAIWAVLVFFFYLVAIGVGFQELIIPSVSLLISVLVLMGKAPADFLSGALYVLLARPFDIGDRITISQPGQASVLYSLVIKDIGLNRTYFLTANGELLHIENHILRNFSMTNLTRSGPTTLLVQTQVPQATPSAKITELVDGIRQYAAEKSDDWTKIEIMVSATDFEAGHLVLDIWATSAHPSHNTLLITQGRSKLLIFIHAYMQSAQIEYVKPTMGVRIANNTCEGNSNGGTCSWTHRSSSPPEDFGAPSTPFMNKQSAQSGSLAI